MLRKAMLVAGAAATVAAVLAVRAEYLTWERHRAVLNARPPLTVPAGALVFAGHQDSSSVSVLDAESGRRVGSIPVPEGPHELAVSPNGRWVVATLPGDAGSWRPPWRNNRRIAVIDVATATLARTIDLAPHASPHGVAFVDDRIVAVTSAPTRSVLFVNVESGAVSGSVEAGAEGSRAEPHLLSLSFDRTRLYSANMESGTVSEIDVRTRTLIRHVPFPGNPVGVAAAPDGTLWAIEEGEGHVYTVTIVDPASGAVVTRLTDSGMARRIAFTPDGSVAVVTDPGHDVVQIYDAATRILKSSISFGEGANPSGVSFTRDSRAFVALGAGGIGEIDLKVGRIVRRIDTAGERPDGLVYVPRK
jgi:YVTN family beta-propeller protein